MWISPDDKGRLQLTYIVEGAQPNLNTQVGFIVVAPVGEPPSSMFTGDLLGIVSGYGSNTGREGVFISFTFWDIGTIQTDEFGNRAAHFDVYPNSGTYSI
jgi:hypothetical protein